jgi:hypothetical protein
VKKEFAQRASHPVVLAAQQLRNEHGVAYDAPMTLALSLDESLHLRLPPPDTLNRFDGVDLESAFLVQLRDFAQQSKFDAFFAAHRAYFTKVEDRMRTAITKENPGAWFDAFMGNHAAAHFTIVPAMLTGNWNYGPHIAGDIFQVIGVARPDFDELPSVDDSMMELVVHEMAHSYVNPLLAAHKAELEPEAARVFAKVAEPMAKQSYTAWDIFLNESVVRAITSLYLRDRRSASAADAAIAREEARSFLWTRPIAEMLDKQRGHFATSVPQLVRVLADADK